MDFNNYLRDDYGRFMRKLRVSLNDVCNFRCFYCMPEDATFVSKSTYLSEYEIFKICSILVENGVEQIRLTGGEPLLRQEFDTIVSKLGSLPLQEFGLTTNGFYLRKKLAILKKAGCTHINVSLDSLQKEKFNQITRSNGFQRVYEAILDAQQQDFHVKVNAVLMRGVNDDEVIDFARFSETTGVEVRFLEVMRIGQSQNNLNHYMDAQEAIDLLKQHYNLKPISVEKDSTSFKYGISNTGKIGFIASESKPFCSSCSRLRLSFDGFLRACLMSERGHSLKGLSGEKLWDAVKATIRLKPTERIKFVEQNMFEIGG